MVQKIQTNMNHGVHDQLLEEFCVLVKRWLNSSPSNLCQAIEPRLLANADDRLAATYELAFWRLLESQGLEVSYSPALGSKTPDFSAGKVADDEFYCEVACIFRNRAEIKHENSRASNGIPMNVTTIGANLETEAELIQKVISKKASKYGAVKDLNKPLLIVLGNGHGNAFFAKAIEYALFGAITMTFGGPRHGAVSRRFGAGILSKNIFLAQPQNTRISGVLFLEPRDTSGDRLGVLAGLYHNPWAKNPIEPYLFPSLRQFVVLERGPNGMKMGWQPEEEQWIYI
ncbi:MAG: hypothetical protein HYT79_03220 [Elusimicrobia bacterium]|nr:hypothetical protein [Elusimicrobiota bacterium]